VAMDELVPALGRGIELEVVLETSKGSASLLKRKRAKKSALRHSGFRREPQY
jgi:hypothetical protein